MSPSTNIGRHGDTVESIRELIVVLQEIERTLRLYLRRHPEDEGIERVLEFRSRVAEEFEELLSALIVPRIASDFIVVRA